MRSFIGLGVLLAVMPAFARTLVVQPGGSIQTAVNSASAGDRIVVHPGTYVETASPDIALTITSDGIELVGLSKPGHPVILENAGTQSYGVWVSPENSLPVLGGDDENPPCDHPETAAVLNGFSIRGFTIRGFAVHGVHLACVNRFSIVDNRSEGNLVYGLFPVLSRHGLMAGNIVTGTTLDAAVYVGQSDDVLITGNEIHDSLLGIEIENSRHCAAVANEVHDNTAGILVDLLPFLRRDTQRSTLVAFNSVHRNNRKNDAKEGLLSVLPAGSGIVVVGGHGTTVLANDVRSNGFTGIAVASLCFGWDRLRDVPPCKGLPIDPEPRNDQIIGNRLKGNGKTRQSDPTFDAIRADLIWDGSGTGNCWSGNRFSTSSPQQLPACD
jgi:parallel beta-helix repeat protein